MTKVEATKFVREQFPRAREGVSARDHKDKNVYIYVGLSTVLGSGRTTHSAWVSAAKWCGA